MYRDFPHLVHYNDVIIGAMASHHQPHDSLPNRLFKTATKLKDLSRVILTKHGKPRYTKLSALQSDYIFIRGLKRKTYARKIIGLKLPKYGYFVILYSDHGLHLAIRN